MWYTYIYIGRGEMRRVKRWESDREQMKRASVFLAIPVLAMRVNILKASRSVFSGKRQTNITPQIRFNAAKRSK